MYRALYRKWRPQRFEDVVGQRAVVAALKNQVAAGRVGHAYLFTGVRGTGKTTCAKIFAKAVNCLHPVGGDPCGQCEACRGIDNGSILDVVEMDAASNNGVDDIRDLRDETAYTPSICRYKVYIIDEVHMLSPSAFNAVLKTLEEPPAHALFILATTEPQKIPATILSRCMRFDFKLIPREDIEGLLRRVFDKTGKEYDDEAVSAIARAGAGSARDALSIADMCASYAPGKLTYDDVNAVLGAADFTSVAKIVNFIFEGDAPSALSEVESVLSTGKGVGTLCKDLLTFLNNVAIAKLCKNARQILSLPDDRFALLYSSAERADGHKILRVTEVLAACESDMRYALNGAITLETAILKCALPESDYNIDSLISRIAALEKKVEEGVKVKISQLPVQSAPVQSAPVQAATPVQAEDKASPQRPAAKEAAKPRPALAAMEDDNPFASQSQKPAHSAQSATSAAQAEDATQPTLWESAPPPAHAGSLTDEQKSRVFGNLLKLFRTTRRNAVLFTLCMDLESSFEGDELILYTDTDAVFKALNREENARFIREALAELGVFSFQVKLKPKGESKWESAERKLRENFKGIDIDIK